MEYQIVSISRFHSRFSLLEKKLIFLDVDEPVCHTKGDITSEYFYGTIVLGKSGDGMAFILSSEKALFVGDQKKISALVEPVASDSGTPFQLLFFMLDRMVDGQDEKIRFAFDKMEQKEDELEIKTPDTGFVSEVQDDRRHYVRLGRVYKQIADLCDVVINSPYNLADETAVRYFTFLSARAGRMAEDARELEQYALRICEMYDSYTAARQNRIMQRLTVLTSIFMPLTLITGWFGMNFIDMPSLRWRLGYPLVIVCSLVITVVEIVILKKNRWLD